MLNESDMRVTSVDITEKSNGLFEKRIENTRVFSKIDVQDDNTDLHNPYNSPAYVRAYQRSLDNPEHFWGEVGHGLVWTKPWSKVLDNSDQPFTKWFVGGELNACYNAVDRHVEANKGQNVALIHDSPLTKTIRKVTYAELQNTVSRLAGVLASLGVKRSDRVLIYMPLIPEAIAAMLATVRLGAIHSVVFGGFASRELRSRIVHAEPKVIIAASCGIEPNKIIRYKEILDEALDYPGFKPSRCIIFQRRNIHVCTLKPEIDMCWDQVLANATPHPCVSVEANHPLYILYTSGTTDDPKGIQRPTGGHLAALAWSMGALYGLQPGSVWWSASDLGWVVGHSYICYGPLLAGITSVMYEGKPDRTPDPGQYFRIIHEHRVNAMFTVPTSFRVIKRLDPDITFGRHYSTESLRAIFVAGEHCDHETKTWVQTVFQVPVLNHWWQTETGHAITASCVGLGHNLNPPNNCAGMPFPGFDVHILRQDGTECLPHELGRIACRLPLPPGTASTLYKSPERFLSVYFDKYPGYYDTMDAGYKDEFGYVYVTARDDDVINVAGHRLSTSGLEDVVLGHPDVADAAVVGVPEPTKGEVPLCLFVMVPNAQKDEATIVSDLIDMVRSLIGPIAVFRLAASVPALPRTRSGKTLRKTIADLARNKRVLLPGTVEDPTVFKAIKNALRRLGYAQLALDPQ